eukprot:1290031-Rhodomonas_salina.1
MLSVTHPEEFARIMKGTRAGGGSAGVGSNKPRAVLFEGPPGCGKTSMGLSLLHISIILIVVMIIIIDM